MALYIRKYNNTSTILVVKLYKFELLGFFSRPEYVEADFISAAAIWAQGTVSFFAQIDHDTPGAHVRDVLVGYDVNKLDIYRVVSSCHTGHAPVEAQVGRRRCVQPAPHEV